MQIRVYLFFFLILLPFYSSAQEEVAGTWFGKLQAAMGEIIVEIELEVDPLSGKLSTSSGLAGMKLEELSFEDNRLYFELSAFAAKYEGLYGGKEIHGHWQQGPQRVELNFGRKEQEANARLQTPKTEEGYRSEEFRFNSAADDIQLGATLTLPIVG